MHVLRPVQSRSLSEAWKVLLAPGRTRVGKQGSAWISDNGSDLLATVVNWGVASW